MTRPSSGVQYAKTAYSTTVRPVEMLGKRNVTSVALATSLTRRKAYVKTHLADYSTARTAATQEYTPATKMVAPKGTTSNNCSQTSNKASARVQRA